MRMGTRFDNTAGQVADGETDPRKTKFHLSRSLLLRIGVVTILPMLLLSALAYYLEQYFGMALAIGWFGFAALWQALAYGYGLSSEKELAATNYYPHVYLIFGLTCLFGMVGFIAWRLWERFPN
jgi:hypothetical protein